MKKERLFIPEMDLELSIEQVNQKDYINLTEIAKKQDKANRQLIIRWIQNTDTLRFLEAWEKIHNPNFNVTEMRNIRLNNIDTRQYITPQKYIKATQAVGIISKAGRYGGTLAHKEIALNFCYWLSPEFQVFLYKAFTRLLEQRASVKNLKWHISKITDNIEEVRNLLDTIPQQEPKRNRLNEKNIDKSDS